ncbi:hypothetical protein ACTQ34_10425, partial [Agathobaculum sp. LCP25S3_E8]|uniref:hypothetical protein n=1 Tax=Agathobaculum sp. LCP25S3_E8 TaxID=3438735 RepID=UPI003F91DF51
HPDPFFLVPALLSPPIPILPRSNEKAQLLLDFFDRLKPVISKEITGFLYFFKRFSGCVGFIAGLTRA